MNWGGSSGSEARLPFAGNQFGDALGRVRVDA